MWISPSEMKQSWHHNTHTARLGIKIELSCTSWMVDVLQMVCLAWNVVLGICILLSYYIFLYCEIGKYDMANDDKKQPQYRKHQAWLWSPFFKGAPFYIWMVAAVLATASYLVIFVGFICIGDWSERTSDWPEHHSSFAVCNGFFLVSSGLYAPLMESAFKAAKSPKQAVQWEKVYVLATLALVALSAIGMAVCAWFENTGWLVITASIILALHCSVLDAGWWCSAWYNNNTIDDGNEDDHAPLLPTGDPVSGTVITPEAHFQRRP